MKPIIVLIISSTVLFSCNNKSSSQSKNENMETKSNNPVYSHNDSSKVNMSDSEWQKILPSDVYNIAREKGTERPFTGKYNSHDEIGTYYCAACGNPLFASNGKFESSCG